ncbi:MULTISPECIES: hypothetical protein [unclassified Pseudomonas]|nr:MULTISPECIES: hypothetical protein [unclassified Pseudomonas]
MQITISLFDRAGRSLGQLTLAASTYLIDLETLRNIGAWRVGIHK